MTGEIPPEISLIPTGNCYYFKIGAGEKFHRRQITSFSAAAALLGSNFAETEFNSVPLPVRK